MESLAIVKEVEIEASVEQVWNFVGTSEGLSKWYNAEVTMEAKPGGRYVEKGQYGEMKYVIAGHVVSIDKPREVVISCRVETTPASTWPVYTTITTTLEATDFGTRVCLVHSGFENLPEAYREDMFGDFTAGWTHTVPLLTEVIAKELA